MGKFKYLFPELGVKKKVRHNKTGKKIAGKKIKTKGRQMQTHVFQIEIVCPKIGRLLKLFFINLKGVAKNL